MTLLEQIEQRLRELSAEKQCEVLDFVTFLQLRQASPQSPTLQRDLSRHPPFGSWRPRNVDALAYQQARRAEWDTRP